MRKNEKTVDFIDETVIFTLPFSLSTYSLLEVHFALSTHLYKTRLRKTMKNKEIICFVSFCFNGETIKIKKPLKILQLR